MKLASTVVVILLVLLLSTSVASSFGLSRRPLADDEEQDFENDEVLLNDEDEVADTDKVEFETFEEMQAGSEPDKFTRAYYLSVGAGQCQYLPEHLLANGTFDPKFIPTFETSPFTIVAEADTMGKCQRSCSERGSCNFLSFSKSRLQCILFSVQMDRTDVAEDEDAVIECLRRTVFQKLGAGNCVATKTNETGLVFTDKGWSFRTYSWRKICWIRCSSDSTCKGFSSSESLGRCITFNTTLSSIPSTKQAEWATNSTDASCWNKISAFRVDNKPLIKDCVYDPKETGGWSMCDAPCAGGMGTQFRPVKATSAAQGNGLECEKTEIRSCSWAAACRDTQVEYYRVGKDRMYGKCKSLDGTGSFTASIAASEKICLSSCSLSSACLAFSYNSEAKVNTPNCYLYTSPIVRSGEIGEAWGNAVCLVKTVFQDIGLGKCTSSNALAVTRYDNNTEWSCRYRCFMNSSCTGFSYSEIASSCLIHTSILGIDADIAVDASMKFAHCFLKGKTSDLPTNMDCVQNPSKWDEKLDTTCSEPCLNGGGTQSRTRQVVYPQRGNGKICEVKIENCPLAQCEGKNLNCVLSDATTTTDCTKTCGGGNQTVTHKILNPGSGTGKLCPYTLDGKRTLDPKKQEFVLIKRCNEQPCP